MRASELTAYQNAAYATTYLERVESVRRIEAVAVPGSTELSEAVAQNLYKLMAYKDEYEVARLCLDPRVATEVAELFGPGAKASWRLHPPALRAMGMKRKLSLGPWFRPGFRALYAMRRLRGTAWDPFGLAKVRVVERELLDDYVESLHLLQRTLNRQTVAVAVEIAGLPDLVRGFEEVKLSNLERYRTRLAELRLELEAVSAGQLVVDGTRTSGRHPGGPKT